MERTADGRQAEFFVVLSDQADLSLAETLPTKSEKGRFVYQTLLRKAQATQDSILQLLRDRAIEHRSFYIVNAVLVKGTRELAETLAARPEVARIEGNPLVHNELPEHGASGKGWSRTAHTGGCGTRESITFMHRKSGRLDSPGKTSLWPVPTPACGGHTMLSSLIIAVGTGKMRITISTGTTQSTTAPEIPVVTIHRSLAMISFMVVTLPGQRWVMTDRVTRSAWRPGRDGLVAATWIKATALQPDTSNAWSSSSHRIRLIARLMKATLQRLLTLLLTRGVVPHRKVVQLTHSKPLWQLKALPGFRWLSQQVTPARLVKRFRIHQVSMRNLIALVR